MQKKEQEKRPADSMCETAGGEGEEERERGPARNAQRVMGVPRDCGVGRRQGKRQHQPLGFSRGEAPESGGERVKRGKETPEREGKDVDT